MGVCLSCCGWQWASDDPSESQRLLFEDPYQSHYGSAGPGAFPQGTALLPDPEELKRERDALERLCAQTSDKLIDVSQPPSLRAGTGDPSNVTSKISTDYPHLFAEAFTPSHKLQRPSRRSQNSSISSAGHNTPHAGADEPEDHQAWLKRIIERDTHDRRWDWRVVNKIDGDLTFAFDELVRGSEAVSKVKSKG